MICNPILPAIDKLTFTDDSAEMVNLLEAASNGGEPWIVFGVERINGNRTYMMGRIDPDRVKDLPKCLDLYKEDTVAGLRRLISEGCPELPTLIPD